MACGPRSHRCCRLNGPSRGAVASNLRPRGTDGDPVRAALGHALGVAAPGDGLRFGDDLLAASAGLAEGRSVGPPAARAARPARSPERDRLQSSVPRQRLDRRQKGGPATGPNPTDRGKPGTKRHVVTDAKGIPLALKLTGANVHDSRMLEAVVDAVPPIRSCWGPPRKRPLRLHADKAYDHRRCRQALTRRRIQPRIARRGIESSQRLDVAGGSSSARWRGSPSSVASPSATSGEPTSISPSPRWPQPSSSGASSNDGFVRRSKVASVRAGWLALVTTAWETRQTSRRSRRMILQGSPAFAAGACGSRISRASERPRTASIEESCRFSGFATGNSPGARVRLARM